MYSDHMVAPQRVPGLQYASPPRAESRAAVLAWPPRIIVVHDTGNPDSDRFDEASYAANRADDPKHWTSAHAYVDQDGPLGSLRLDRQAWAAYSYANAHGLHVELCLSGDRAATRAHGARLVRTLCQLAGIPMIKLTPTQVAAGQRGVCGHHDVTVGLGVGDHIDPDRPGAPFPWADFMSMVNSGSTTLEDSDLDAGQSQRLTNTDQTLYALGQLATPAVGVNIGGATTQPLPLVDLLKQVRDDITTIKGNFVPPFHGSEGGPVTLSAESVEAVAEALAGKLAARLQQ